MTAGDGAHWDRRYAELGPAPVGAVALPGVFAPHSSAFPTEGAALDLACGQGRIGLWLAELGLTVHGSDVSAVAIEQAAAAARQRGVSDRCRFEVLDLDGGLPVGPPADVIVCHMFRDERLDRALVARLAPGGLLAIAALSEVGAAPGRFRTRPGELAEAFADLDVVAAGEGSGTAWLMGRRPRSC
ncbi:class I SAM-dependent methyltransferase [Mycolicibacterium litorale]|uniref:SAM-dependent methyltransferase n=1 Tax=Mycolicibacterium litorale TaxID=758802 RepID=A0AAD1MR38_9MYCO|nr:class I SAM-dependent methyltransferase [Mycolicibacterium litorale]MCV7418843.1 class I SAM-dependent methyltransferase [Mycolicibacterium litorale]TDY00373.1 methyltransferase family protein [Mycolicibacterium litorale]BBY15794.1 SAM-dependent methyltransferase [Mycolicibacterium litorale]